MSVVPPMLLVSGHAITKRPVPRWNRPSYRETSMIAAWAAVRALPRSFGAAKLSIVPLPTDRVNMGNLRVSSYQTQDDTVARALFEADQRRIGCYGHRIRAHRGVDSSCSDRRDANWSAPASSIPSTRSLVSCRSLRGESSDPSSEGNLPVDAEPDEMKHFLANVDAAD